MDEELERRLNGVRASGASPPQPSPPSSEGDDGVEDGNKDKEDEETVVYSAEGAQAEKPGYLSKD